jgi:ABC-type sugar transport system substrate-binding protein
VQEEVLPIGRLSILTMTTKMTMKIVIRGGSEVSRKVSRRLIAILSVLVLALAGGGLLAGCGSSATTTVSSATTTVSSATTTVTTTAAFSPTKAPAFEAGATIVPPGPPKRPYKLGIVVPLFEDQYWVSMVYGEIAEAEKLGVTIEAVYSAGGYANLPKQISQMEDLIQRKVDAILFSPNDYQGAAAVANQAVDAGIPVILAGNQCASDKAAVGINNSDMAIGKAAADWIGDKLNGQGKVALLAGPAGAQWSEGRAISFKGELKAKYPGIELSAAKNSDEGRNNGQSIMEDWIQAFPQLDAVFAVAASLGEGAAISIKQAGRNTLVAMSTLTPDNLQMLKSGEVAYVQSEQPVLTGRMATQLAIKVLNGEPIDVPKFGNLALPNKLLYQINPAFTKDTAGNIDTSNDWAPEGWVPPTK